MDRKNRSIDKQNPWFGIIYIVFIGLIPLIFSNKLVDGGLLSRQLALTGLNILIASSILIGKFSRKIDFGFISNWIFLLILGFLLLQMVSYFQAIVISEFWQVISKYSLAVAYLGLTAALIRSGLLLKSQLFIGMSILCSLAIVIALSQLAKWNTEINFRENIYELKSNFGNKNLFSSVLFFGVFANIALLIDGKFKKLMIVLIIINSAFLVLIQTRIVLLALILSILVFAVTSRNSINFKSKYAKWILIGAISFASLLLLMNTAYLENLTDSRSYRERLQVWQNSVEMIKDHPITGVGAGNWQFHFPKYGIGEFENPSVANALTTFQRPHNDLLWIAGESGWIGLAFYLSFLIGIIVIAFKKRKDSSDGQSFALIAALVLGYLIIALADFPLERIEHQILLYSFIAIPVSTLNPYKRISKWTPVILILFVSLASIPLINQRIKGEVGTKKMYALQQKGQWKAMLEKSENSQNESYKIDSKSIPLDYYGGIAAYTLGDITKAKTKFESALIQSPYNIHALNNLGSCYNQLGNSAEAMKLFDQALSISPKFEEAILNKCVIYYNQKNFEEAYSHISQISILTKNKSYPQYLKAILIEYLNSKVNSRTDTAIQNRIRDLLSNENNMTVEYIAVRNNKGDEISKQIFPN